MSEETGIERYFRELEEKEDGFECLCGHIPHFNFCRVYNARRKQEREALKA